MVASVFNGNALAIIAGELAGPAGRHLDLDLLAGQGRGARIIQHSGELKQVDPQQQRVLQRIASQDDGSCHELCITAKFLKYVLPFFKIQLFLLTFKCKVFLIIYIFSLIF